MSTTRSLVRLRAMLATSAARLPTSFLIHVDGQSLHVGQTEPAFEVSVRTPAGMEAVLSRRELAVAEAYVHGDIDLEGDLVAAMGLRDVLIDRELGVMLAAWLKPLLVGRTRCNPGWIALHYDAGNLQLVAIDGRYHSYTPGLYPGPDTTLEEGAVRKYEAAFAALHLHPGDTLLDVGCGWGGFVRYCAERQVDVTAITLSRQQLDFTRQVLARDGLTATVSYQDFFTFEPGRRFDAISLMGVLEDLSDYRRVAARLARWVEPHGRIYADFAASSSLFGVSSFITKHVWPGRFRLVYLPGLLKALGAVSLEVLELANDRHNYYLWVKKVHDRWCERRPEVVAVTDERTWRRFRLLCAGVAATMTDGSDRASAYRLVAAPRRSPDQGAARRTDGHGEVLH